MDVEWAAEDSASSGSGNSPKTASSNEATEAVRQVDDWTVPPLVGRLSNTLELFDPTNDGMATCDQASYAPEPAYAFDPSYDIPKPNSSAYDATSDAFMSSFSTSGFEGRGNAFDQLGTSDDHYLPSAFASPITNGDMSLDMAAWTDPSLYATAPTSGCIQPSDLFVKSEPSPFDFASPATSHSDGRPALPPAPAAIAQLHLPIASTSALPGKARVRKPQAAILPPLATSAIPNSSASHLNLLILGLRASGARSGGERLYTTRAETAQRIQLVLTGPSSDASIDFGSVAAYTDEAGVLREDHADHVNRISAYQYLKLDKCSPIFRRGHRATPPAETLYLESHVYCTSSPDTPIRATRQDVKCMARGPDKGCISRERKRWADRVMGSRRTHTDTREELISGEPDDINANFDQWARNAEAMFYNEPEIVEIAEGCASLQLRLLHYARCYHEPDGYFVSFVLRNHLGQVVASAATPSIFVTDDHKAPNARTSAQPSPAGSSLDDLSASSSRSNRRAPTSRKSATGTARASRRTSSTDSGDSQSASGKRTADPAATATTAKRRRGSGYVSRSSLCMTPRDPGLSGTTSPAQRSAQLLSEPVSFEALSSRLGHGPMAMRGTSPSSEATSSSLLSPEVQNDLLAGLHRAEQSAPLNMPQRARSSQPRIEDVIPLQGPLRGGTRVAVIGTGFRQNSVVYFGLTPSQTDFRGSTSLICTLPPGTTAGPVNVHFGIEAAADPTFTYLDETETTLTVQGVSLIAATLGLTALDLTKRFDELRRTGQFGAPTGILSSSMTGTKPPSSRRERRASIGDSPGASRDSSSSDLSSHSRAKSMTDIAGSTPPPPPRRSTLPAKSVAPPSSETILLSLFALPNKRLPTAAYADAVKRASTPEKQTVLHLAAILGMQRLVQLLIERGVYLNLTDVNGLTALHFAALHGHASVIRVLLAAGAATDVRTNDGLTAYMLARDHEREDVSAAFPPRARVASRASSASSMGSYLASGSSLGEYSSEGSRSDRSDDEAESSEDEAADFVARPLSAPTSLNARNLRSRDHLPTSKPSSASDEEDASAVLSDSASVSTARPSRGSRRGWFNGLVGDSGDHFWTPISTAWWQPRRGNEAPAPTSVRMYKPSEATELADKVAPKTAKMQAALSRRLGYATTSAADLDADDVAFARVRKHRTLWHDHKLFLIWLPALLLAFAYFLHSAALLPDLRFVLLPARLLRLVVLD